MAMNVEILIGGLALCYDKENYWNIVFIGDDLHPADLYVDGAKHNLSPLMKVGKTRRIRFNIERPTPPTKGVDFHRIFNIAADYAHGPGNLNVKPTGHTGKIWMQVPSAALGTKVIGLREYFVQDATRPGSPPLIIDPVAKIISATFNVTSDLNMIIEENGEQPITINFPYRDGELLELKFDNDCGRNCRQNDFIHYYDWVEDSSGKKVYAGQVRPRGMKFYADADEIERNRADEKVFVFRSADQGNCDPIGSDPPPGP